MVESGFDQFVTASINFIVAPPGTPIAVRQQLSEAVARALASDEVKQAFAKIGAQARPASPEQLASLPGAATGSLGSDRGDGAGLG